MGRTFPDNSSYMYAAYAVAAVVYFGYAWLLWRRNVRVRNELAKLREKRG